MAAFEALLFAMLGRIVDWLGATVPARAVGTSTAPRWAGSACIAGGQHRGWWRCRPPCKHQTLAINFPMRLRWNFHRLMLGQSMAFYQDEFAGRV